MPFGWQLALWLVLALLVAAGAGFLLWWGLGRPDFRGGTLNPRERLELIKIALAVTGGIGGVVALVVAYRRQRLNEAEHRLKEVEHRRDETKLFNERYASAVDQLGSDKAAIRLGGVYAMAGLADDWEAGRQKCIDVLCAYLRMPYTPPTDPDNDEARQAAGIDDKAAWSKEQRQRSEERQVRHTVIRLIRDHLRDSSSEEPGSEEPGLWCGHDFDFTGAIFDGGDFSKAVFDGGTTNFNSAKFTDGNVSFLETQFTGGTVKFSDAKFTSGTVDFKGAKFSGGIVNFSRAKFTAGTVDFERAKFTGCAANFSDAEFTGSTVKFSDAKVTGGHVDFSHAKFTAGTVDFKGAKFTDGTIHFSRTKFTSGHVDFSRTKFTGSTVEFKRAEFTGGTIHFSGTKFTSGRVDFWFAEFTGSTVDFTEAEFTGGRVYLSDLARYDTPPVFDVWEDGPPDGLRLPPTQPATSQPADRPPTADPHG